MDIRPNTPPYCNDLILYSRSGMPVATRSQPHHQHATLMTPRRQTTEHPSDEATHGHCRPTCTILVVPTILWSRPLHAGSWILMFVLLLLTMALREKAGHTSATDVQLCMHSRPNSGRSLRGTPCCEFVKR